MPSAHWPWPYPRFVAHRGGGWLAPENTLAAMRVGQARGYRMVEIDARLSGDGTLVLMHDDDVDRTTNGTGRVGGLTWGELARLDAGHYMRAKDPRFAGEPVPALEAIAHWCLANRVAINIEIKPCPGREAETGSAVALDALRLWREAETPPLLSSFNEVALAAAQAVAPELQRALLQDTLSADWPERLARLGCVALDANFRELSAAVVADAHRRGYSVACYTPNDQASVGALLGWGVDCIITDAIDLIDPNG
ncbi:MAG: glycerophosphodiester phosphodiesterase [Betaproteobacteria bacterium]